ncbi:uncharacterized protein LOC116258684 [Nymphaea colorata]|nr:uncharacterized protein LOC116258684 [Nymphaea colorata]
MTMTMFASSVPSWWLVKPAQSRRVAPSLFHKPGLSGRSSVYGRVLYGRDSLRLCRSGKDANTPQRPLVLDDDDDDGPRRRILQMALWAMEGVYIGWLFLLPYAPGDPVWAIKTDTIKLLVDLSLNFFFILPLTNSVGIHVMEAPTIHPVSEALFNFVIAWTLMFAPLLFKDRRKENFSGSLEILWVVQMFLTNTLLIPYMAIRLGDIKNSTSRVKRDPSWLALVMTGGATVVAVIGAIMGVTSIFWGALGRSDEGFGTLADRWDFLVAYLGSDRPTYAFIWDICLYSIFQPWLISDNIQNVDENRVKIVNVLRFVPYFGLVAYLLSSKNDAKS